jgi:hypothetical protein
LIIRIIVSCINNIHEDLEKKLHEELHNLYTSPNVIRMNQSRNMRWAGHAAYIRREIQYFGRKTEGKMPLWRPSHTWKDDIKMNLRETGCDMNRIHLAQDRSQ